MFEGRSSMIRDSSDNRKSPALIVIRVRMSRDWTTFNLLSGIASIVGLVTAIHFYLQ